MITLTDLFCGAGGSSTGAVQVPGVSVRVASNHWDLAVETHEANHPDTGHVCADLSQIDPRYYPRTDILWASPECTNHSIAKGSRKVTPDLFNPIPDEAQERSRATMWDVPRFTEVHRYSAVIVENVVDVARWHPYQAWLMAMDSLGYEHEVVFMNSMHAWHLGDPAPQSRDRFYAIFWRKGNRKPDLQHIQRPPALCEVHGRVEAIKAWKTGRRAGRYRQQYVFRCPEVSCRGREVTPAWIPASSIIDWSDLGTRIGDRSRPLAEKTMRRIQAGIDRYWTGQERGPLVVNHVSGSDSTRTTTVHDVAPTMVAGGLHASLLVPVEGREGKAPQSVTEPYRTQTTRNETGLLTPFIAELRGGGSDARSTTQPLATVTASGNHHALIMRNNGSRGEGGEMVTPALEPLRTVTTAGHQSLLTGGTPSIEDASFRMLSPDEIKRAMAFPKDYRILGTKRDQVRMSGNAVTPPAARDLIAAVASSLESA